MFEPDDDKVEKNNLPIDTTKIRQILDAADGARGGEVAEGVPDRGDIVRRGLLPQADDEEEAENLKGSERGDGQEPDHEGGLDDYGRRSEGQEPAPFSCSAGVS